MNNSVETALGSITARLDFVIAGQEEAKKSRKEQYKEIEAINVSMVRMENRIEILETSMTDNAPTIKEFITIKHKVIGAGILGKWLWGIGGVLLGLAFAMREALIKMFTPLV